MALAEFENPHYVGPLQTFIEQHLDLAIAGNPVAMFLVDGAIYALDASLPTLGQLDALKPGKRSTFTTVGYGLQRSFPPGTPADDMLTQAERLRMVARPHLLQIK